MKRVLVANRGEPVIRAVKTLRRMGIATAVVYAPEDAAADWLAEVDFAYPLAAPAGNTPRSTYLDGAQIVAIARANGCDGVWPGWGFLAEDVDFAGAVIAAGLTWIGPPPAAMQLLGSKARSSALAQQVGVPTIPEVVISCQLPVHNHVDEHNFIDRRPTTDDALFRQIEQIGYPLLLKPALGGGGQGQTIVRAAAEFPDAWAAVCRINATQFQNGPILIQRYLASARHIEAQVLADTHGTTVVFHERECSIQRRNQKIIEESPSSVLTEAQRAALRNYAHTLATAAGYASAGTLEFLFVDQQFYFLEMNTRLQVEHPITEETTRWVDDNGRWRRIDLFEEMVQIAMGRRLRLGQDAIRCIGHAIEARIYAEDPARDFHPCPGTITSQRFPVSDRFRVETALRGTGSVVDARYDPMLAKLIAWGETRELAIAQLRLGLERTTIGGVTTNVAFLHSITENIDFCRGTYSTDFVKRHPALCAPTMEQGGLALAVAAIALYERDRSQTLAQMMSGHVTNVAAVLSAVPPNGKAYTCTLGGRAATLRVGEWSPDRYIVQCVPADAASKTAALSFTCIRSVADEVVVLLPTGETCAAGLAWHDGRIGVTVDGATYPIDWAPAGTVRRVDPHVAPGGGRLIDVCVAVGASVVVGDQLYVTEAMKMEARVLAAFAGTVTTIHTKPGEAVEPGQCVLEIAPTVVDSATAGGPQWWSAAELHWPSDASAVLQLFQEEGESTAVVVSTALEVVQRYFHGYDIPRSVALRAVKVVADAVKCGGVERPPVTQCLTVCCEVYGALRQLISEDHAHATVYFVEHVGAADRRLPKETAQLLESLATACGLPDMRDSRTLRCTLLHWLQAAQYHLDPAADLLYTVLEQWGKQAHCRSPALTAAIRRSIGSDGSFVSAAQRPRWRTLFRDFDWEAYYAIEQPPVAREYWDLYEQSLADPLSGIAPAVVDHMRAAAQLCQPVRDRFLGLKGETARWLDQWFAGFGLIPLPVSRAAEEAGVSLYAAWEPRHDTAHPPRRLVAIAQIATVTPMIADGKVTALPEVERAAIEIYWALRAYDTLGLRTALNHAFLFLPKGFSVPWQGDLGSTVIPGLSPEGTRRIARRVAGFARHLRIVATEVVLTLGAQRQLIQVWHARDVGVLSRPPMPLTDRLSEAEVVGEKAADLRQQRLGKLLNPDRARLLFDGGKYEELFFPEVDDDPSESVASRQLPVASGQLPATGNRCLPAGRLEGPVTQSHEPIGLNVYRGRIGATDALVYAGDFRHRGGALGEREGKKLAASVVLAYALQVPLVGIHDGAGANIKGSVASLGWAGAYFGAIAATGGFSSPAQFQWWFHNHHERAYFEKVLQRYQVPIGHTTLPLIHLHLHLGAAVGMLVYGPSVSSCSIMVDHPEVYRLLTGAATVERVTGEKGTNYTLGGASVHGQLSGEIDFTFPTEEVAIHGARALCTLVRDRTVIPVPGGVQRAPGLPQPELPISAGVVVGREAIEANVDGGVFWEMRDTLKHAGGLLTGYARLRGQPVVLAVTATDYGMHHGRAFKKMQLAAAAAHDFGLPLIIAVGANWDRLHPVVRAEAIYQQHEMRKAIRDANVPKIGLALGPRSLERSLHEMMDLIWYVERGTETAYERQRARILTHGVTAHFATAMDWCADILRYLPRPWELHEGRGAWDVGRKNEAVSSDVLEPVCKVPVSVHTEEGQWAAGNDIWSGRGFHHPEVRPRVGSHHGRELCKQTLRRLPTNDPTDRLVPELTHIIPTNLTQPYDMRDVIVRVMDVGSFREFAPGDGQPLHVGVAALGGRVVGIIADAPNVDGGAQTVVSISKFTRFHRFCARFQLPIIELNDSPAFRPGKEQERSGIQGEGGKSIREEVLSAIPKIAVTLRQNYGGRYIHANLVTLGPPRRGLIVEGARLGVMGADGAVGVLHAKELSAITDPSARAHRKVALITAYEQTSLNPQQVLDLGYAEAMIPMDQLRIALARTLGTFDPWEEGTT